MMKSKKKMDHKRVKNNKSYIKNGTGKKGARKIYCNVRYDQFEIDHIQNLKTLINAKAEIFPQK